MGERPHLMVDDEEAFHAWRTRFEQHVTLIARQLTGDGTKRFALHESLLTAAMVQAYHEGVEGLRKRGH